MIDDTFVRSPCIRNCCLDDNDICLGCFRSLEEIRNWSGSDNPGREQILRNAERRRQSHPHPAFFRRKDQ